MTHTIAYITNRFNPELNWVMDSLCNQCATTDNVRTIVVDSAIRLKPLHTRNYDALVVNAKPTVWSGPSRLTKEDWWSKANSINTAICLCKTDWITLVDDRSVLMPQWLQCVKEAIAGNYVMVGAYEKRRSMTVQSGVIRNAGIVTGKDSRLDYVEKYWSNPAHHMKAPYTAPAGWVFGCSITMPLEWALQVNGADENCDGLGAEDSILGLHLANNGFPIKYDPRCMLIEDRTPEECQPVAIKKDYGDSPNDYSHKLLNELKDLKRASHPFDIRALRSDILSGKDWPAAWGPQTHPYTKQHLSEL